MIDTKELREKITIKGLDVVADTDILVVLDRLEAAEKERDKLKELNSALCRNSNSQVIHNARLAAENYDLRAKIAEMERQEPAGTLHDDGYFVWRERPHPYQGNYAGWKMVLYALPGAKGEEK